MKVFIINPERKATAREERFTKELVRDLEEEGYEVWWSKRDNPDDMSSVEINTINVSKLMDAKKIYVVYPESTPSEGSIFEYGWLWALYHLFVKLFGGPSVKEPLVFPQQVVFANKHWFKGVEDSHDGFVQALLYLEEKTSRKK